MNIIQIYSSDSPVTNDLDSVDTLLPLPDRLVMTHGGVLLFNRYDRNTARILLNTDSGVEQVGYWLEGQLRSIVQDTFFGRIESPTYSGYLIQGGVVLMAYRNRLCECGCKTHYTTLYPHPQN